MSYYVLRGRRPDKPANASAIGFSDSLWDFTNCCWDGKAELRPEVAEVVRHLGEATASWDGLMPPCVQVEVTASGARQTVDLVKRSEFDILLSLQYRLSNIGTDFTPVGPIGSQSFYQFRWEEVINAINKARGVWAPVETTTASGSEETSGLIKYSEFEFPALPRYNPPIMAQMDSSSHIQTFPQKDPLDHIGHLAF